MSCSNKSFRAKVTARNNLTAAMSYLDNASHENIDDDVDVCASFQKDLAELRKQIAMIQDKYNL